MSLATYSFLPYLRQGLANSIKSASGARGKFSVTLEVQGGNGKNTLEPKDVELYGPGDITGIDPRVIIKTEPHTGVTNFDWNYLAYLDFYDEDFPWRYTPASPSLQRLDPWIALVVLAEGEFSDDRKAENQPLPSFSVNPGITDLFPRIDQLWAWAHVHVNESLTATDDAIVITDKPAVDAAIDKFEAIVTKNPDRAYSRLMCPRKLGAGVTYHAFLVPAYESGRLAGMGEDAAKIDAAGIKFAWKLPGVGAAEAAKIPYYYRWKFATSKTGNFEYLVNLLKPKVADSRVGRRVMDMTKPEGGLTWEEDPDHDLGGILRLGGALRVPKRSLNEDEIAKAKKFDEWASNNLPVLHPFQDKLVNFLNLADNYAKEGPGADEDPIITPPIYGRWHAKVERLFKDRDGNRIDYNYNWLTELNLDPRFRVPAHFGTRVVQENQEDYMQAAWEQIGEALKANKQVRYGQFAIAASSALHLKHFAAADAAAGSKHLLLTAPLQKRIVHDGATVFHTVRQSMVPEVVFSGPMRRIVRPRGPLVRHLQRQMKEGEHLRLDVAVSKINSGELEPAPPKKYPPALPSVNALADQLEEGIPGWLKDWLRKYPWLPYVPLVLAILVILLVLLFAGGAALAVALAVAAGLIYLWWLMNKWLNLLRAADASRAENRTPESVDELPASADFRLTDPEEKFIPKTGGTTDSVAASQFKRSLKDLYRLLQLDREDIPEKKPARPLDLEVLSHSVLTQIRPEKTVPAWTWQHIYIPPWLKKQLPAGEFVEIMGYPKINLPMYEPLKKISNELFLPNIERIAHDSITLLETNQAFIESYMVGLNHEFARELLWREYPTDQMGSYFRQFWDVSGLLRDPELENASEEDQREPYYDIPKLHEWTKESKLGDHDHPVIPGQPQREELVLVIRGELLKKYPNTVVYAHKARWTEDPAGSGNIDIRLPRSLHMQEEGDKKEPDRQAVRTPLYQAKADPDIYFFGFDLTIDEAMGDSKPETPVLENAGWFFVIKERPSELRFGMDVLQPGETKPEEFETWNSLWWDKVLADPAGVINVLLAEPPKLPTAEPAGGDTEEEGEKEQWKEDIKITWDNNIDAANMAYMLYRVPVMMCVHAAEMLLKS